MNRVLLILSLVVLASCNLDNEPPTVDFFTLNSQSDRVEVAPGSTIYLDALVRDNKELLQARIQVKRPSYLVTSSDSMSLTWLYVYDISGDQYTIMDSLLTASDVRSGPYEVTLRVVDEAGNELDDAEVRHLEIIKSTISAQITSPDFSLGATQIGAGDTLVIEATVSAMSAPIRDVFLRLAPLEEGQGVEYSRVWSIKDSLFSSYDLGGPVKIPIDSDALGNYELQLVVRDTLYDHASDYGIVEVLP